MITLVLHEEREPIWRLVRETLSGEQGIELTQEKGQAFYGRSDLDAVVLTGWVAHERFGGRPKVGEAQVLSTHDRPSRIVAPWVVAIPSFPGHPVFAGNERLDIVPDDPKLTTEEETYLIFAKVFEAVDQFNATPAEPKIQRLGCDLDDIFRPVGSTEDEMRRDIRSISQAYRDYSARVSS